MIVYLNQGQFIRKKKQGYQNFDIESIFRLKIPFNWECKLNCAI